MVICGLHILAFRALIRLHRRSADYGSSGVYRGLCLCQVFMRPRERCKTGLLRLGGLGRMHVADCRFSRLQLCRQRGNAFLVRRRVQHDSFLRSTSGPGSDPTAHALYQSSGAPTPDVPLHGGTARSLWLSET